MLRIIVPVFIFYDLYVHIYIYDYESGLFTEKVVKMAIQNS